MPPFFGALVKFSQHYEYSRHTPGHSGGTAFLKSPAGQAFHRFFGENLLRSDLSVSVDELGSLLDHSGPVKPAENYAAKTFGADMTFFVTNGTSTSNRILLQASVIEGDLVLVDRNCHKSIEQGLALTGAVPTYLIPTRNGYGIIGPIHLGEFDAANIESKIAANPLVASGEKPRAVHGVLTNSTYDGLCYNVKHVGDELGKSVDRIHYDEAWYSYARFNPLYTGRYGMHDEPGMHDAPTIFATQSTHKLLAALSQAFMMHSSTSPQYAIIASNDVSTKTMAGASGRTLTGESISEAVAFRKTMARIDAQLDPDWFFKVWQPDTVTDPDTGHKTDLVDAPDSLLCTHPSCWTLNPGEKWHGFEGLTDDYCMLDPIKVSLLTPGIDVQGAMSDFGIPTPVVTKFLDTQGIVVEKTGDYCILFLFSIGITKGKWGTLVDALFDFKRLFDEGASVEEVFPDLIALDPKRYAGMTVAQLCHEMHTFKKDRGIPKLLTEAFAKLPEPAMTPVAAYRLLVRDQVEQVPVQKMDGRVVAVGVVPYPPGIPIMMPGERAGADTPAVLEYMTALQDFDNRFPGFEHDSHGVEFTDGEYLIYCIKEGAC